MPGAPRAAALQSPAHGRQCAMLQLTRRRRPGILLLLATAAATGNAAPFSLDTAPGRLPKDVVPLDYTIAVVPDLEAKTFTGTETVTLRVRAPTARLVFNSLNERLRDVRLDGKPAGEVVSDDHEQLTTVTLNHVAAGGRHTLTFAYSGTLETQPHGLFVQPFNKPDGATPCCCRPRWKAPMRGACCRAGTNRPSAPPS